MDLLAFFQPKVLVATGLIFLAFLVSRRRPANKAPLVSYWIPWIGSALSIGSDPDGFFRRSTEKYGPVFAVKTLGREITYVTSPSLMGEISKNSRQFVFSAIRLDLSVKLFLMDPKYVYSSFNKDTLFPAHHRFLSPLEIRPLLNNYAKHAYVGLIEALEKFDGTSTPFRKFIIPLAYEAAAYAFFGRSFPAKESHAPFIKFDSEFHLILAGMPKFLLRKNYAAWEEVIQLIEKYLKTPHEDCIEYVNVIYNGGKAEGWTERAIAESLGSDLWALQANAVQAAFWVIVMQLQQPGGLTTLREEVDLARESWVSNNPECILEENLGQFIAEASLPLLVSTIQESLRHCSSVMSIRDVQEPLEFAGYQFDKGEQVVCATRVTHLDPEIHEDPCKFVPDRYLNDAQKKHTKDGVPVPNHSLPFGFGVSKCEGRHFAMGELKTLTSLLLLYTTIEIDPKSGERPSFDMERRIGAGVFPPKGDLPVVIHRRR